jgi:hypothetical protein
MAEEKDEKKKASIVKRIFKWLGLGLITFLLIVSIIFQAPWKVITLFAVIFLACTILPKPYKKYFWLSVAAVVIALIIWVFLPEEDKGWRPYTFDEELAALKAKYTVPDEENAAVIYNQLLEDYNEATFEPNFLDPNLEGLIRKEPWSSKDYPEAAQWLKQQENTIETLLEASKIEKCRFPINADIITNSDMLYRLSAMRRWAHLLLYAANNDIAEDRINQGLEKQIAVLQMAKHLYQQPPMLDFLVGAGLEMTITNQLKRIIVEDDVTEEYLNLIEQALAEIKHDWSYDLPRILDYEKLIYKNLCGMFYAVNTEGEIRLNPGVASRAMMAQLPQDIEDEQVVTYWHKRLMKASNIWAWFYMPSTPQKAGAIIDAAYERYYAMAKPDYDWRKEPEKPAEMLRLNYRYLVEYLTGIAGPAYYSIHDTYLRIIAQQRGARLTIALRRYKNKTGHWPESLDVIKSLAPSEIFIDPINGDSFVYKLTEENFTLYSKGKNNIDEDGQYNTTWDPNTFKSMVIEDDSLIWPSQ